jgi:hypothetical protein
MIALHVAFPRTSHDVPVAAAQLRNQTNVPMKKLITTLAVLAISDKGTLQSIDAEKKTVTIKTAEGQTVTRTLTPATKTTGKDGKEAKADALSGKTVAVVSEHGKVQTISES